MKHRSIRMFSALLLFVVPFVCAHGQLVVHEWGTMTTVHAPDGRAQGRLNLIDASDVLPDFVRRFEPTQGSGKTFAPFGKGTQTPGRRDVTMRLETPVIYFYDPSQTVAGRDFTVRVTMRGGVLNEFFPSARAALQRNGVDHARNPGPIALDATWSGALEWTDVSFDAGAAVPQTQASVWLAPRAVRAAKVRVGKEAEHYLFYRGVANLPALLNTRHSKTHVTLRRPTDTSWMTSDDAKLARVWLVDVRADGSLAYATTTNLSLTSSRAEAPLVQLPRFTAADYGHDRRTALWASMKTELVSAGLYADEAEAMLTTWQASYFSKPGLRVFYTVPRAWTDYHLPLELSVPYEAKRVLIGRIDLMTDATTT